MLMIDKDHGIFLIDRKFDFYLVHGYDSLLSLFSTKGVTILDGEMVRHAETGSLTICNVLHILGKPTYLVFDIIVVDGTPCASKPLSSRLQIIGGGIIQPFRGVEKQLDSLPFLLIGKVFLEKHEVRKLAAYIHVKDGERYYKDEKRFHKTDGLIFTPDEPYHPKTCKNLFKWKYLDKLSIDLRLGFNQYRQRNFSCIGTEGYDIEYNITLKVEDQSRLNKDLQRLRDTSNVIVECSYDQWNGNWTYQGVRSDKNRPNHVKVVFDTLECICENISLEEIIYRLALDPLHDDWKQQVHTAFKAILERQKHEMEKQRQQKHTPSNTN
jgi:hypothetical protein